MAHVRRRHVHQRPIPQPSLASAYPRAARTDRWLSAIYPRYLFWGNLPWIVMGVGLELGGLPSIWSYFRPRDGNPFVLAFFFVVFALWILGFWWLFFARGAEFLAEHPGVLRGFPHSPAMIRIYYCLGLIGGIFGVCFMWFSDIPVFTQ